MTSTVDKTWTTCPQGSLNRIVRRRRSRRRNALFRETAGLIVLATSIGFGIGYLSSPDARPPVPQRQMILAGISCQEVHELLPAMMKHELNAARTAQLREHIMLCPECRRLLEQMKGTGSMSAIPDGLSGNSQASFVAILATPDWEL